MRYDAVNAMLLNEFLKEHQKIEELKNDFQSTVALQKKQIQALMAELTQQADQNPKGACAGENEQACGVRPKVALENP